MKLDPHASSIALVTGASSGIGETFARTLAAVFSGKTEHPGLPGFDELLLVARRADRLERLVAELSATRDASGRSLRVRALPLDLVAPGAFATLAGDLSAAGKPLGILVNNAGYGSYGPFSEVDLGKQLGQIDLNCRALTEACGALDSFLTEGSVVINVASLAAFAPLGNFAVYAATKAYVLNFTVALSAEWEPRGIRVCALCPGAVDSEFAFVASGGARIDVLHGWSAERTVDRCLRDAGRGKRVSVPRFFWKLTRFAVGLAGPVLAARVTWRTMRRPHA